MVPLGGLPAGGAVTADAIRTGGNMGPRLARGSAAVVATGAVGAAVKQAVIRLGTQPGAGGLVAVLAHGLAAMDGSCRSCRGAKTGVYVACCTLRRYRNIGVESTGVPAGVPTLVATVAIGNRHATERLVWYVVGRWTTGRREATGVASAALIGNRCL